MIYIDQDIYAGIGARKTPPDICRLFTRVARFLALRDYVLRSGGAAGADKAFEDGANRKEIWLPKPKFNGSSSQLFPSPEAYEMAAAIHKAWHKCDQFARASHARNCHQILGATLDHPVKFVLCWTPDGAIVGGTATAIRLAQKNNIEVINFWEPRIGIRRFMQLMEIDYE